jgi:diaminohydroxyphosphoribosylaminopyrimidine deaminase/5-amino-6-(5-phosphoribosylamino)uracil reductase
MTEREAMARALALAWNGWGRVSPNPLVGAVLLSGGRRIAEAWHAEFGGPHAEALALERAGAKARGATLVVTLEPCRHQGRTPPCADAVRRAGVARVVFGAADADPAARGGAALLRDAGLAVEGGLLESATRIQNASFFHRHEVPDRPWVAVKLAVSLDGRIADGRRTSRWITGEEARQWVHWLRAGFDAIGVALGTVLADDPQLTVRGSVTPLAPPARVIFDTRAELPASVRLRRSATEAPTVLLAGSGADPERLRALKASGIHVELRDGLAAQLGALRERGVRSLLVEGGGVLAGRLVAAGLVDRLFVVTAPVILGSDGIPAFGALAGVRLEDVERWRPAGRRNLGADSLTVMDRP